MKTETRSNANSRDGKVIEVKECKLCLKGNRNKLGNQWKLFVRCDGSYYCYRCANGGSWFDLKSRTREPRDGSGEEVGGRGGLSAKNTLLAYSDMKSRLNFIAGRTVSNEETDSDGSKEHKKKYVLPSQVECRLYHHELFPLPSSEGAKKSQEVSKDVLSVREYLYQTRGLRREVLLRYGVGITTQKFLETVGNTGEGHHNTEWVDKVCITFPWMRAMEVDDLEQLREQETKRHTNTFASSGELRSDEDQVGKGETGGKSISNNKIVDTNRTAAQANKHDVESSSVSRRLVIERIKLRYWK